MKYGDMFSCFNTILECDRISTPISHVSIAMLMHNKNSNIIIIIIIIIII